MNDRATQRLLRGVKPKELQDVYRRALAAGARISRSGSNHVRVQTEHGVTFVPHTTSDIRAIRNTITSIRRIGLDLKESRR